MIYIQKREALHKLSPHTLRGDTTPVSFSCDLKIKVIQEFVMRRVP